MIKKLRFKFILLSMSSLFVLLTVIMIGINLINYRSIVKESDEILVLLSQNKGSFPASPDNKMNRLPPHMSPELPYESRYFSVLFNGSGDIIQTETSRITAIDNSTAINYAQNIQNSTTTSGFKGNFRYIKTSEFNGIRITFLDCGRKLDSFYHFLFVSCGISFLGFVIVFCIISFFAGKIIHPIAESYEKQKRFITDAGHELKTPLTIINANIDILEMELGKNECLDDIQQQTKRLTALTNDLVLLARMEESEYSLAKIDFPISEVVTDTASAFRSLALQQNKEFICNIQPHLSFHGNDHSMQKLVTILLDNAFKYSPVNGTITLIFEKRNKTLYLAVFNTTTSEILSENLNHVFERFYRSDTSRNSESGGYGIGLSLAKAIVTSHGGKIHATAPDKYTFGITASFPL